MISLKHHTELLLGIALTVLAVILASTGTFQTAMVVALSAFGMFVFHVGLGNAEKDKPGRWLFSATAFSVLIWSGIIVTLASKTIVLSGHHPSFSGSAHIALYLVGFLFVLVTTMRASLKNRYRLLTAIVFFGSTFFLLVASSMVPSYRGKYMPRSLPAQVGDSQIEAFQDNVFVLREGPHAVGFRLADEPRGQIGGIGSSRRVPQILDLEIERGVLEVTYEDREVFIECGNALTFFLPRARQHGPVKTKQFYPCWDDARCDAPLGVTVLHSEIKLGETVKRERLREESSRSGNFFGRDRSRIIERRSKKISNTIDAPTPEHRVPDPNPDPNRVTF